MYGDAVETGALTLVYEILHDPSQGQYWWNIPALFWDTDERFPSAEKAVRDVEEKFQQ